MADVKEGFELQDLSGTTAHFNANAGTTAASVPSSPNFVISEFSIMNPSSNGKNDILFLSLDGGTTFRRITWNSEWSWSLKGEMKQVKIKSNGSSVAYEMVMNFEAF